jgi:hypothetical protein
VASRYARSTLRDRGLWAAYQRTELCAQGISRFEAAIGLQIIFEHAVSCARYVSGDRVYRFILSAKAIIGARV